MKKIKFKSIIFIIVLGLCFSIFYSFEEMNASCILEIGLDGNVGIATLNSKFIKLPFNYIYANSTFKYKDETYISSKSFLENENTNTIIEYYSMPFKNKKNENIETNIELYISKQIFDGKIKNFDVKERKTNLTSGVARSSIIICEVKELNIK